MAVMKFTSKQDYLAYVKAEEAKTKPVATPTIKAATPQPPKATAAHLTMPQAPRTTPQPQAAARKVSPERCEGKECERVTCTKCSNFKDTHCTAQGFDPIMPESPRKCGYYTS